MRVVQGATEIHGGAVRRLLRHATLLKSGASALTLGHVVLGLDPPTPDRAHAHEHIHVRQCERWGPFVIPAYLLASLWLLVRGRRPYLDNPFEREA